MDRIPRYDSRRFVPILQQLTLTAREVDLQSQFEDDEYLAHYNAEEEVFDQYRSREEIVIGWFFTDIDPRDGPPSPIPVVFPNVRRTNVPDSVMGFEDISPNVNETGPIQPVPLYDNVQMCIPRNAKIPHSVTPGSSNTTIHKNHPTEKLPGGNESPITNQQNLSNSYPSKSAPLLSTHINPSPNIPPLDYSKLAFKEPDNSKSKLSKPNLSHPPNSNLKPKNYKPNKTTSIISNPKIFNPKPKKSISNNNNSDKIQIDIATSCDIPVADATSDFVHVNNSNSKNSKRNKSNTLGLGRGKESNKNNRHYLNNEPIEESFPRGSTTSQTKKGSFRLQLQAKPKIPIPSLSPSSKYNSSVFKTPGPATPVSACPTPGLQNFESSWKKQARNGTLSINQIPIPDLHYSKHYSKEFLKPSPKHYPEQPPPSSPNFYSTMPNLQVLGTPKGKAELLNSPILKIYPQLKIPELSLTPYRMFPTKAYPSEILVPETDIPTTRQEQSFESLLNKSPCSCFSKSKKSKKKSKKSQKCQHK